MIEEELESHCMKLHVLDSSVKVCLWHPSAHIWLKIPVLRVVHVSCRISCKGITYHQVVDQG